MVNVAQHRTEYKLMTQMIEELRVKLMERLLPLEKLSIISVRGSGGKDQVELNVVAQIAESKTNRVAFDVCLIEVALKDTPFKIIDWKFDNTIRPDNDDNVTHLIMPVISYTEKVNMSHGNPFLSYTGAPQ